MYHPGRLQTFSHTGDLQEQIKETAVRNHFGIAYLAFLREMEFMTTQGFEVSSCSIWKS